MTETNPTTATPRPATQPRSAYRHFGSISTRWMDNDAYGHINNAVYYSYFDTAVNRWLIEAGVLDVQCSPAIGLVVETHCNYFSPLACPQTRGCAWRGSARRACATRSACSARASR
jgi:acyl-CoA thioester hydrolase